MKNNINSVSRQVSKPASDKSDILEKAHLGVVRIFALCAEDKPEHYTQIENEMQGWVATLLYAGYDKEGVIALFQTWQSDFERKNKCIDEQLHKIFDPYAPDHQVKNNKLFENMVINWIEHG